MCIYRIIIIRPARARYATPDAHYRRPITERAEDILPVFRQTPPLLNLHTETIVARDRVRLRFHDDDRFVDEYACIVHTR